MKKKIDFIFLIIFLTLFLFNSPVFAQEGSYSPDNENTAFRVASEVTPSGKTKDANKIKSKQEKMIDDLMGRSLGKTKEILVELEKIELRYIKGLNQEDIDMVMSAFHPKARNCTGVFDREFLLKFFENRDHIYNLLSFKILDSDKELAVTRVKYHVECIEPKASSGNLEFIHIFKKDKDQWKLWQVTPLSHNENEKDMD